MYFLEPHRTECSKMCGTPVESSGLNWSSMYSNFFKHKVGVISFTMNSREHDILYNKNKEDNKDN